MVTVDCPHSDVGVRQCAGCGNVEDGERWCEGEITARVYRDCEGDAGVIGGLHSFIGVEDEEATCGCSLSEKEWDVVRDQLAERGNEPPDPSDSPWFPY